MSDPSYIEVNGVRLAYTVAGRPDAPPILLLHALGSALSTWDKVVPALVDDWRVYALDLRGHGHSDDPHRHSFELMRDDVVGFLDAMGLDRVTVVGHSMGGTVAFLLVEAHPSRVDRLVVEDVTPPVAGTFTGDVEPGDDVYNAIFRQLKDPDPVWWELTATIPVPVLLIAGGPDSHVSQDRLAALAERIPDCRLETIPVGHRVHSTDPERFTATLLAFLASN
jgi:pimeloyl-ACP methyl ester carboxylesterase